MSVRLFSHVSRISRVSRMSLISKIDYNSSFFSTNSVIKNEIRELKNQHSLNNAQIIALENKKFPSNSTDVVRTQIIDLENKNLKMEEFQTKNFHSNNMDVVRTQIIELLQNFENKKSSNDVDVVRAQLFELENKISKMEEFQTKKFSSSDMDVVRAQIIEVLQNFENGRIFQTKKFPSNDMNVTSAQIMENKISKMEDFHKKIIPSNDVNVVRPQIDSDFSKLQKSFIGRVGIGVITFMNLASILITLSILASCIYLFIYAIFGDCCY